MILLKPLQHNTNHTNQPSNHIQTNPTPRTAITLCFRAFTHFYHCRFHIQSLWVYLFVIVIHFYVQNMKKKYLDTSIIYSIYCYKKQGNYLLKPPQHNTHHINQSNNRINPNTIPFNPLVSGHSHTRWFGAGLDASAGVGEGPGPVVEDKDKKWFTIF